MLRFIYCMPLWRLTLLSIVIIICHSKINSYFKKSYWQRLFNFALFLLSLFALAYTTILGREGDTAEIELQPFYTFIMAQSQVEYYRTFFMNALLFVPLGLSMPYCLSKNPRKWPVFVTIAFAALLSAGIEFAQYYYHLGRCETDDVIANTLGAVVGAFSYLLYMYILKNQKKGSLMKKINNNQKLLLDLCAKSLFDKDINTQDELDYKELIEESKRQTVFTTVYSLIKDKCDTADGITFSQIVAKNIRVEYAHNEVHRALSENNIPYVILKGVASASYYKEPMLRMMGDVDVLVSPEDILAADKALKSIGFATKDAVDSDDMHIGYKRKDGLSCELHRNINGIPQGEKYEVVTKYLKDIFASSINYKTSNGVCVVPNKLHHGIILLLHTASHLTKEGVGLRHLCDWAVFVNSFSNDEFVFIFEKPLKEIGLWRFAQLLTLCSVKYLGCDAKEWTSDCDNELLTGIITDILNGGNFGVKDADRYNQIKYISDREEGVTTKKNPILQLLVSINQKTKIEFAFVNKYSFLLPVGWIFTICKYLYLVIVGKRRLDNVNTINNAKLRKNIYNEFRLYKND